jgi:hypothetical protein
MKLISEVGGTRTYDMEDGTFQEVRARIRGTQYELPKKNVDQYPEVGAAAARMIVVNLDNWARAEEVELIRNSIDLSQEVELRYTYLEDEDGDPVLDDRGEPVIDESVEPVEVIVYRAEIGFWPHPRDPRTRYRVGLARGDYEGVAIQDTWEPDRIMPIGNLDMAITTCRALNDGMSNPLAAAVGVVQFIPTPVTR